MDIDTIDLLTQEYLHLQSVYESFDDKALLIKGWSISLTAAICAASRILKTKLIVAISLASTVMFWLLEAIWKTFQKMYLGRIERIELAFREKDYDLIPLQITGQWSKTWDAFRWDAFRETVMAPSVIFPHVLLLVLPCALLITVFWQQGRGTENSDA